MARTKSDKHPKNGLAAIPGDAIYPQHVFLKMAGLGKHAFAVMRKNGLRTSVIGNRVFVSGEDFKAYAAKNAAPGVKARQKKAGI